MTPKSGSTGTGEKKSPIVVVIIAVMLMLIVAGVIGYGIVNSGSDGGSCSPAPAPYQEVHNQNVTILNGDGGDGVTFTIIRGIVGYGKPQIVDGKQPLTFPACYSADRGLMTVTDVNIRMSNGTKVHLEVGVVPAPLSQSNQPEVPAPTSAP